MEAGSAEAARALQQYNRNAPPRRSGPIIGSEDTVSAGDKGSLYCYLKILQVIDENNALCQFGTGGRLQFWFEMPTNGMVDGKIYDMEDRIFEVTGTKAYTTALGVSKTVFVFRLAKVQASDIRAAEDGAKAAAAAKAREAKAARLRQFDAAKWRTWTAADGKHRTEAKFLKVANGVLTLEKKDGKTVEVRLEQLSSEDQDFVRQRKWMKAGEADSKTGTK
jgi:hypothetical protein